MAYSNPTHLYYPDPTTIPTFSPFYSTNTPLTTPSPNLCFNHGYTPHSPTPSSSPSPYATSTAYVHPYSPPPLTPSSSSNPYFSSATTPPNIYSSPPHSNPYSSYVSQQQPHPIQYSTFPSYPHHLHDPSYHTSPNLTHITTHSATEPTMASHTPFLHQQPTHTHIFNHSQPIAATIPDVENLRSFLNEILEFKEELRHEMKDSFLDAKKSFQALSDSFKLKTRDKKLPEKIVKKASEKQSAEEVEPLTQPPQQLSPSPVSTPSPEFANRKNGYATLPAISPPDLLPSPAPPPSSLDKVSTTTPAPHPPPKQLDLESPLSSPLNPSPPSPPKPPSWELPFTNPTPSPPQIPPNLLIVQTPPPTQAPRLSSETPFTNPFSRPPPKPKYEDSLTEFLPPSSYSILQQEHLFHRHTRNCFSPSDWNISSTDESWTSMESTISLIVISPLVVCHVSSLPYTTTTTRNVFLFLLRSGNSTHQLVISNPPHNDGDTPTSTPRVGTCNNWFPALFTKIQGQNSSDTQQLFSTKTTMGRKALAQCFYGQNFVDKNYMSQVTLQFNSIGPAHTRPARKPPD
ncbi:unnamed protein product [Trifolium pratense]|uniref:Uncharacterized protein n=1 Tax=Trifolium pratense TaxID=57577 RepID=A0ACB0J617_TRIPR|nr:unnamed protein product [Trifolium pratense]